MSCNRLVKMAKMHFFVILYQITNILGWRNQNLSLDLDDIRTRSEIEIKSTTTTIGNSNNITVKLRSNSSFILALCY